MFLSLHSCQLNETTFSLKARRLLITLHNTRLKSRTPIRPIVTPVPAIHYDASQCGLLVPYLPQPDCRGFTHTVKGSVLLQQIG
ncbi:hypothetical protein J6590_045903 [Homalodisca vitripennis]|nr:hypothetical protein J6590_045903 [Homalodisca vitripennis]